MPTNRTSTHYARVFLHADSCKPNADLDRLFCFLFFFLTLDFFAVFFDNVFKNAKTTLRLFVYSYSYSTSDYDTKAAFRKLNL